MLPKFFFKNIKQLNFKSLIFSANILQNFLIAITTRKIKNKKQAEKVLKLKKINIVKQIHSDRVIIVKKIMSLNGKEADGIITNLKNYPIAVKVADCIGTIIIDPQKKVLAVIHSGWRGIAKKIIAQAIKKMIKEFGCYKDKIIVITSPCVGPCCYEIGWDLYNKLRKQKIFSNIFRIKREKIYMDLQKANKKLLLALGIKEKNIYINKFCTKCNNDLFFSYRAEGKKAKRIYVVGMIK